MGKNTNNQTSTSLGNEVVLIPVSEKGGMGIEQTKALMELMITTTSYDADGDEDGRTATVIRGRNENHGVACYDLREGEGKSAMLDGYTRMIEARTNQEARRINAEIKKNTVYICETPLDAIDQYDRAQQRGEDVYFRPPTFVFFGKEAVDHFDAMQDQKETVRESREIGYVRTQKLGYDMRIDPRKVEALENAVHWKHLSSTIDDGELKPHLHNVFPNCVRHELPPAGATVRIVHTFRPRTQGKSAIAGRVADIYRGSAGLPLAGTVFDPRRYRRIK